MEATTPKTYTVKQGDTLNNIAKSYGFQDYKQAGITGYKSGNPDLIYPGENLAITGTPLQNPGIVSTTQYRNDLSALGGQVDELANDPYAALFERMRSQGADLEDRDRLQARADAAKEEKGVIDQSNRYRAGLETLGIQSGLSRYASNLQMDKMLQAENLMKSKLAEIDDEEKLALAKAKQARSDNDLEVLREQLEYVQDLRKAKAEALSDAQKMAFEREKFDREMALDWAREGRLGRESSSSSDSKIDEIRKLFGSTGSSGDDASETQTLDIDRLKKFNWGKKREKIGLTDDLLSSVAEGLELGATLEDLAETLGLTDMQVFNLRPYIE